MWPSALTSGVLGHIHLGTDGPLDTINEFPQDRRGAYASL